MTPNSLATSLYNGGVVSGVCGRGGGEGTWGRAVGKGMVGAEKGAEGSQTSHFALGPRTKLRGRHRVMVILCHM